MYAVRVPLAASFNAASNASRASTDSMPVSCTASGPGVRIGPSDRSRRSLRGGRNSDDRFVRPSMIRIARGTSTPVR